MATASRRLATVVCSALLWSVVAAPPAAAAPPTWSHHDARVCSQTGAGQVRCTSIVRTFYRDGQAYVAGTESDLAAAAAADRVSWFGGADLRTAYGISALGDPSKVIAIVDAYDDPNAFANLTRFRLDQNLPVIQSCSLSTLTSLASTAGSPCFAKVNQTGGTSLPSANADWANEIDLDLQAASAICPMCSILLLEASSTSIGNLGTAVTTASNTAHVLAISNSYGISGDYPGSLATAFDNAAGKGIAVVASSGDGGYGVLFPASATKVIGVGGTTLAVDATTGARTSETAWAGTGSGCSRYNAAPAWQSIPGNPCAGKKAIADVSADADPNSGLAIFTTYNNTTGYWVFGGTSLSSPLIAALYAMQGGYGGSTLAGQYAWSAGTPHYDVTSGSNGSCSPSVLCTAGTGWDGPTGLGSISVASSAPPALASIAVTPASASLQTGQPQQFTAAGRDQYGQPIAIPSLVWSVAAGGVGSVDASSGLYSAGPTAGTATVTAASGPASGTARVTVTAAPASDFTLSVSPSSQSVKRGATATFAVTISRLNGFADSVTLSVSGAPSGSTVSISPNPATGTSATISVATKKSTAVKAYTLTVTGTSGGLSRTATTTLTVTK
jgi:hypothetical protein